MHKPGLVIQINVSTNRQTLYGRDIFVSNSNLHPRGGIVAAHAEFKTRVILQLDNLSRK